MALGYYGAVLVLDSEKCALGEAALSLVRSGIHTLYANDLDEAALMARQEGERLRGVVMAADSSPARIDAALEVLGPHSNVQAASIVLLGSRPNEESLAALQERGIRWFLWEPHDATELRFLATLAIYEGSDVDVRIEPRVPTALRGSITLGGQTRPVRILDLTTGGAFIEVDKPPSPGRHIGLEIALPDGPIQIVTYVRWVRVKPITGPDRPAGAGLEFKNPRPEDAAALRAQMDAGLARYQLR
jgi:Tfp pilus assembly protein PilZ